jgi:hypothetical protein
VVVDYEIDFCLMLSRWLKNLLWILQYPLWKLLQKKGECIRKNCDKRGGVIIRTFNINVEENLLRQTNPRRQSVSNNRAETEGNYHYLVTWLVFGYHIPIQKLRGLLYLSEVLYCHLTEKNIKTRKMLTLAICNKNINLALAFNTHINLNAILQKMLILYLKLTLHCMFCLQSPHN